MKPFNEILANAKEVVANRIEVKSVYVVGCYVKVEFSDGSSELLSPETEATVEFVEKLIEKRMARVRLAVKAAERLRHDLGLFDEEETEAINEQNAESFNQFVMAGPDDNPFADKSH